MKNNAQNFVTWWYAGASLSDMLLNLQHTQVAPEIKLSLFPPLIFLSLICSSPCHPG